MGRPSHNEEHPLNRSGNLPNSQLMFGRVVLGLVFAVAGLACGFVGAIQHSPAFAVAAAVCGIAGCAVLGLAAVVTLANTPAQIEEGELQRPIQVVTSPDDMATQV